MGCAQTYKGSARYRLGPASGAVKQAIKKSQVRDRNEVGRASTVNLSNLATPKYVSQVRQPAYENPPSRNQTIHQINEYRGRAEDAYENGNYIVRDRVSQQPNMVEGNRRFESEDYEQVIPHPAKQTIEYVRRIEMQPQYTHTVHSRSIEPMPNGQQMMY